ncbi:MAG: murein hydrolase activator EnvC family protein, partial [Burkholderiales bacterium]
VQSSSASSASGARPAAGTPASAARPAAASPSRPAGAVGSTATGETAAAVQATPLPASAIESRAIETRPLDARPLESRPAAPPGAAQSGPAPSSQASVSSAAASSAGPSARGEVDFAWPVPGRMLQGYTETGKGIALSGNTGEPVFAAAEGRVIFSGSGPRGYGNLIIVKHANELLSVYAHNSKLLVKEGQSVARGDRIAELGDSGGSTPRLHFEIRRQGKPVDPLPYLPRR